jgi:hypothetical protein
MNNVWGYKCAKLLPEKLVSCSFVKISSLMSRADTMCGGSKKLILIKEQLFKLTKVDSNFEIVSFENFQ